MTLYDYMVHYNPRYIAAQPPPPMCPKCGNHRTEVVGLSDDGRTMILRCHVCGERSEMKMASAEPLTAAGALSTNFRIFESNV